MSVVKINATPTNRGEMVGNGWGAGKSVNAETASERGAYNATELSRLLKIKAGYINERFDTYEWHHTSSRYNKTAYYDYDKVAQYCQSEAGIADYAAWVAAQGKVTTLTNCSVEWLEWGGSLRNPTCEKVSVEGAEVTIKGATATIYLPLSNITVVKRLKTKGLWIARVVDNRDKRYN